MFDYLEVHPLEEKYGGSMDQAEYDFITSQLAACDQPPCYRKDHGWQLIDPATQNRILSIVP